MRDGPTLLRRWRATPSVSLLLWQEERAPTKWGYPAGKVRGPLTHAIITDLDWNLHRPGAPRKTLPHRSRVFKRGSDPFHLLFFLLDLLPMEVEFIIDGRFIANKKHDENNRRAAFEKLHERIFELFVPFAPLFLFIFNERQIYNWRTDR